MIGLFNVVWFVLVGWWSAACFFVLGCIFAVTIIGMPIGKALFQFAKLNAVPFGKEVIKETELKGNRNVSVFSKTIAVILNIIWFPIGLIFTIVFIISGLLSFITIVGIPVGIVYVRMGKFLLFPIGTKVVSKKQAMASAVANEIDRRNGH